MSDGKDIVDLGFSRWQSDMVVLGVGAIVQVLIGAAIVSRLLLDARTTGQIDTFGVGFGLIWAASMAWFLPYWWVFMRSRLLVGAAGVQLNASGRKTYRWAQIEGFDVSRRGGVWGLTSVGADMRLRDGQVIRLALLDHFGNGEPSIRAIAEITRRVEMMNRLLAEANDAPDIPRP
jgi:hypothetical protein